MVQHTDAYPELQRDLRFFPLGVDDPTILTHEQIPQCKTRGFLHPFDVLTNSEIMAVRAYFDDLLEKALAAGWDSYEMTNWHKQCRGVWDIVQDLLGETVILCYSHVFAKLPGDGKRVSWHPDASYWPLTPSKVVSAWLAIDDVDVDNGAMQVIPGSHTNAQVPFATSTAEENNVIDQTVPNPADYGDEPVALELRAGQISLHSDWILHGSEPNESPLRRGGLAIRFLSSDVRAYNGWNENSIVCRGLELTGHWADHPRPPGEQIPVRTPDDSWAPVPGPM